jgi:hypothetical protein
MRILRYILLTACSLLMTVVGFSQPALQGIIKKLQEQQQTDLQEKLFVHLDRSLYATGENIWFKVYVVDGYTHQPLEVSKVAYLEVLDRNQQPVIQTKIELSQGLGSGVVTIPISVETENYTVRAYTNWMKNFSEELFFHQTISIINPFQRLEEKKTPATQSYDVQFFPEGGHLVNEVKSKVAFRVVNAAGIGIDFNGILLNQNGDTVVTFQPLKYGIGNFIFTPNANENYQVHLKTKEGSVIPSKFPTIEKKGYSIYSRDTTQNRIKITLSAMDDVNDLRTLYFIAHTRQIIKVATALTLTSGKVTFMINKSDLGEGVTHFTVFNQRIEPVCERLYFKKPEAQTSIEFNSTQQEYSLRSKVTLNIASNDHLIKSGSLAVFKIDSISKIKPADIRTYFWLLSEVRGNIESPEYYFTQDASVNEAVDNLMLTHGWSRFKWEDILHKTTKSLRFLPEYRGHLISGTIKGIATSQPLLGLPAYASTPDKKVQHHTAYSQADGLVLFETTNLYGSKKLIAQTGVFKDSASIEINSPFSDEFSKRIIPPLKLTKEMKPVLTERSLSMQSEDAYHRGRVINKKTGTADSTAFYGVASERYLLDDYTRFPLMEEVLREYVKGVRVRKKDNHFILKVMNTPKNQVFSNDPLVLLDGVAVFDMDKIMEMDPLKIRSIDVVTNLYHFGNFVFEGIISLKTYKHDLAGFQFAPGTVIIDYEGLQTKKEFFAPRYETTSAQQSRLPDMRNLLLWDSEITTPTKNTSIDFYTSDLTGSFQAVLQGITTEGRPVYETCTFLVKEPLP